MEQASQELIRQLSGVLARGKGWMRLVAILSIIYGVVIGITIVGLLVAWLPIWVGVVLYQAAGALEEAEFTGSAESMQRALLKLKSYFTIMGVLTLIGLLIFGAGLLFGFLGAMMGGMGGHGRF